MSRKQQSTAHKENNTYNFQDGRVEGYIRNKKYWINQGWPVANKVSEIILAH